MGQQWVSMDSREVHLHAGGDFKARHDILSSSFPKSNPCSLRSRGTGLNGNLRQLGLTLPPLTCNANYQGIQHLPIASPLSSVKMHSSPASYQCPGCQLTIVPRTRLALQIPQRLERPQPGEIIGHSYGPWRHRPFDLSQLRRASGLEEETSAPVKLEPSRVAAGPGPIDHGLFETALYVKGSPLGWSFQLCPLSLHPKSPIFSVGCNHNNTTSKGALALSAGFEVFFLTCHMSMCTDLTALWRPPPSRAAWHWPVPVRISMDIGRLLRCALAWAHVQHSTRSLS